MGKAQKVGEWVYGRRSAFVVGTGALVVTMLCVGGAVALMTEEQPRYEAGSVGRTALIPTIVTADLAVGEAVPPGSVDRLLAESRDRSVQTIEAGEVVYTAAERSAVASPAMLRQLRGALDEASRVVEHEPPDGASLTRRERHLEELETGRTSVLDAASVITQVRHVPAEDLPEGTTTVTDPVIEQPEEPEGGISQEPSEEPSEPLDVPTDAPSGEPSDEPSGDPSDRSTTPAPTDDPSEDPGDEPSGDPTTGPSPEPTDDAPTDGGLQGLFGKGAATDDPAG